MKKKNQKHYQNAQIVRPGVESKRKDRLAIQKYV